MFNFQHYFPHWEMNFFSEQKNFFFLNEIKAINEKLVQYYYNNAQHLNDSRRFSNRDILTGSVIFFFVYFHAHTYWASSGANELRVQLNQCSTQSLPDLHLFTRQSVVLITIDNKLACTWLSVAHFLPHIERWGINLYAQSRNASKQKFRA